MPDISTLSDEYFQLKVDADPLMGSVFGVPGCAGRLPDLSAEHHADVAARLRRLQGELATVGDDGLSEADRVTKGVLAHELAVTAQSLEDGMVELSASGMTSPHGQLFFALPKTDGSTAAAEDDYLARLAGIESYLGQAAERFRDAAKRGRVPNRRALEQALGQLDAYQSAPQDVFGVPFPGSAAVGELLQREMQPAVARYREVLANEILPQARPDEECGLAHLPGGADAYAHAVVEHTTTARTPEELHQLGLQICEQLREEYAVLGERVFGTRDFDEITDRLRHDEALRYHSAEEIEQDARAALARAEEVVPEWFGIRHRSVCEVRPISELEAPDAVLGYYQPPVTTTGQPGRHWINTHQPETRTRYEYEALAFHESVPGHHLQIALSQEMDLPAFRKYGVVAAFSEGWALYTERLADEMGLYSGDLARFGVLSFDSWRACRLVVDTGMHARGWGRQQAIDFMVANSALTPQNIANEVDRYITWPGQALAYMSGRLEIDALRRDAKAALGARFDIKDFHDVVLGNGGVPLTVLHDVVARWSTAAGS